MEAEDEKDMEQKASLLCQKEEAQRTRLTCAGGSATTKGERSKVKQKWLLHSGRR